MDNTYKHYKRTLYLVKDNHELWVFIPNYISISVNVPS